MEYLVNGKKFSDLKEAQDYEEEINKEKEEKEKLLKEKEERFKEISNLINKFNEDYNEPLSFVFSTNNGDGQYKHINIDDFFTNLFHNI